MTSWSIFLCFQIDSWSIDRPSNVLNISIRYLRNNASEKECNMNIQYMGLLELNMKKNQQNRRKGNNKAGIQILIVLERGKGLCSKTITPPFTFVHVLIPPQFTKCEGDRRTCKYKGWGDFELVAVISVLLDASKYSTRKLQFLFSTQCSTESVSDKKKSVKVFAELWLLINFQIWLAHNARETFLSPGNQFGKVEQEALWLIRHESLLFLSFQTIPLFLHVPPHPKFMSAPSLHFLLLCLLERNRSICVWVCQCLND